ncbi:MAG: carboxypeptidase-like regulatory domain-containing protein [Chloroflexota bacterium]
MVGALTARRAGRALRGALPQRRFRAPALVLAAALAAGPVLGGCAVFEPEASPSPAPTPLASGVRGTVLLGPTCEGATRADACTEPYVARLLVLDVDGGLVGEVTSDGDGGFALALPPGVYTIQPAPPEGDALFPVAFPVSLVVGEGEWTEVGIDYDTGIR